MPDRLLPGATGPEPMGAARLRWPWPSSGDFVPALGQFPGSSAGLSAAAIIRLTEACQAEQRTFGARDLSAMDYVYLWADGIHVNIRLEEHGAVPAGDDRRAR
jgi:hypothetical protein